MLAAFVVLNNAPNELKHLQKRGSVGTSLLQWYVA